MQQPQLNRRSLLRGALATAALAGAGSLVGCAGSASETPASSAAPAASGSGSAAAGAADNPFGVVQGSKVEAVIFNGGYGIDYAENAAKIMGGQSFSPQVTVAASTQIGTELQPRFAGGNPPDVIDNSGKDLIGISAIVDQLEDLATVVDAKNLEGTTIRDTLYNGVLEPGTIDGKLAVINYVLTVYATWYSSAVRGERLDRPQDLGGGLRAGHQGEGQGQVPLPVGQGGRDLLPDHGHRLGHQGGRRRDPPGA